MAKPSAQLVIKDAVGAVGAYAVVQITERIVKPDPESFVDEAALAVAPIAAALFMPAKWSRQGAALGGAAMYPLLTRLAVQIGII
jgi:hypothetical protein